MNKGIYKLTALTNMHPGSGDLSYGVIDKLVQRDPASGFPVIHASGMKGSIKEFWESYCISGEEKDSVKEIFGDNDNPGKHKFLTAHLLTLPVRSNVKPFFRATCPAILEHLAQFLGNFGFDVRKEQIKSLFRVAIEQLDVTDDFLICADFKLRPGQKVVIEDWEKSKKLENVIWDASYTNWFGNKSDFVILRDDIFVELCENLPVIARNRLIEPTNLWYEELIPRQSEFWFAHLWKSDTNLFNEIKSNPNPLQIGANATIGQGYCQITEIEKT